MKGLYVPGVTRVFVVAILHLFAGVMFGCTDPVQVLLHVVCHCEGDQLSACLRRLTVWTLQFIALATSAVLMPPCSMPKAQSCRQAGTLDIFLLVFFRVSRKASLVS